MPKNNYDGLQIVRKTFAGIEIGFVVGWWFYKRRYYGELKDKPSFRSIRNGLIFPTLKAAKKFRDGIEKNRKNSVVVFEETETPNVAH